MPEFRSATVRSATATGFALNFGYFGAVFVLTLHFQRALAATPERAGLMFLPMSGLIIVSNLLAGRMVSRLGARLPLVAGRLVEAAGFLGGSMTGAGPVSLVAVGMGAGLASPPMMTALLKSVPPERAGTASGVLNAVRQLGGALGPEDDSEGASQRASASEERTECGVETLAQRRWAGCSVGPRVRPKGCASRCCSPG